MDDDTRSPLASADRSDPDELRQRATDVASDLNWVASEVVAVMRHYRGLLTDVEDEAARLGMAHLDWRDIAAAWLLNDLASATDAIMVIHDAATQALDV